MKKIISFLIYNLKKNSLIEYLHTFIGKAETCPTIVTVLVSWFTVLKVKFQEAERIYHITLKSPITELLSLADGQRDGIVTAIKAYVHSFEKSKDDAERKAARTLMVGLTSIKHNTNDQYIEQTGQVDNLLYFLMVQETAAVETLGIGNMVAKLKSVNDYVHDLIEGRVNEIQDKEIGAFEKARAQAEDAYREFVLTVNSWARLNADKLGEGASEDGSTISVAEFIDWANSNIELFDRKLLKDPANKVEEEVEESEEETESEETEEEEETEQEPVTKTITYTHMGQVFTTQTYEVGAPISLPEAPSGYFWKNPPTKMPDHDITIVSTDDPNGIL